MDVFEKFELDENKRLHLRVERYDYVAKEMRKLGLEPTMGVMDDELDPPEKFKKLTKSKFGRVKPKECPRADIYEHA